MKNPIIIPELVFGKESFPLNKNDWESWKNDLENFGVKIVINSRQFLEDCEEKRTDLIAETGDLLFKEKVFSFTAQLDCGGFFLYVGELSPTSSKSIELSMYLKSKYT